MRAAIAWKVPSHTPSAARPIIASSRSRISRAALLVKVTASNSDGKARPVAMDMREPGGQHAGLAGAGAGQHQHRPVDRLDGTTLRLVEAAEVEHLGVLAGEESRFGHALHDIAREARMMHPHPPKKAKKPSP